MPWVKEEIAELRTEIRRHKNVPGYEFVTEDLRKSLAETRALTWRQQNYEYAVQQLREEEPDLSLSREERHKLRRQKQQDLKEKWKPEPEPEEDDESDDWYNALIYGPRWRVKYLPVASGPPIDPIGPWPKPKKPRKRRPHKILFPTGTETEKRKALRDFIKKRRPDWKGIKVYRWCITIDGRGSVYFRWLDDWSVPTHGISIWDHITRQNLEYAINRFDHMSTRPPQASDTGSSD
jgi:hypothetical protein